MRLLAVLLTLSIFAPSAWGREFYVAGAGGVPISVTETGAPNSPGILFIHGIGQGKESFRYQFESVLAKSFHLVAFDLRGHGSSGKPWQETDYSDPKVWAEDVAAVMRATGLRRPVVVAWSYGGGVAADIVRVNGADSISGLVLIGSLGGFVDQLPPSGPLPDALIKARQLQLRPSAPDQYEASKLVVPMLSEAKVPQEWRELSTLLGAMVPAYARGALQKHPYQNKDLMPQLRFPVLIVHGDRDLGVPQDAVTDFLKKAPRASASTYKAMGHSPFAENPARFNTELETFVLKAAQLADPVVGADGQSAKSIAQ